MKQRYLEVVPFLGLLIGACSSSHNGAGNGVPSSVPVDAYCNAEIAWRDRCQDATCAPQGPGCPPGMTCPTPEPQPCDVSGLACEAHGSGCLARIFQPAALTKMRECADRLACDVGLHLCSEDIVLPDPLPSAAAFASECQAKQMACAGQVGEQNFFCFDLSANTDEYIAVFRACLDGPCASIRACHDRGKFDAFCATD